MNESVKISVTTGEKELYRFQLYSVFCNFQGAISLALSVLMGIILVITWNRSSVGLKMLLFIMTFYYPVYKPIQLFIKSKLLAMQETFTKPVEMYFCDEIIEISQGEEKVTIGWQDIYKLVARTKDIYIYTGKIYAYIISKEQTGDDYKKILMLAESHGVRINL